MKMQGTNLVIRVLISLLLCGVIIFWGFHVSAEEWNEAQKEVWQTVEASIEQYENTGVKS